MNGILSAHRIIGGQVQTIMGIEKDVAATSIGGLIGVFNSGFNSIRPATAASTEYDVDSEVIVPSSGTGGSTTPNKVWFSVTTTDTQTKTAKTTLLYAEVNYSAVNPDATRPNGAFVAMDDAYYKSQSTSASPRHHLDDAEVWVDTIIVKQ